MGYYVRVFCTATAPPVLSEIQSWLQASGSPARIEDADLQATDWGSSVLTYKEGKLPILIECDRDTGEDSILREEIEEFLEFVADAKESAEKKQVAAHLKSTRFVVACQLPTSDIDDDGFDANGNFLMYFVKHCGGLVQADGEGFYCGDVLLEV